MKCSPGGLLHAALSQGGKRVLSRAVHDGLGEHRLRYSSRALEDKTAGKARVHRCITGQGGVEALVIFYAHNVGTVESDGTVAASSRHSRCTRVLRFECTGLTIRWLIKARWEQRPSRVNRDERVKPSSGYRPWGRFWGDTVKSSYRIVSYRILRGTCQRTPCSQCTHPVRLMPQPA